MKRDGVGMGPPTLLTPFGLFHSPNAHFDFSRSLWQEREERLQKYF